MSKVDAIEMPAIYIPEQEQGDWWNGLLANVIIQEYRYILATGKASKPGLDYTDDAVIRVVARLALSQVISRFGPRVRERLAAIADQLADQIVRAEKQEQGAVTKPQ